MNHHSAIDTITAALGARLVGNHRFFSNSLQSPPIGEVIEETDISLDHVDRSGIQEVSVDTPAGTLTFGYNVWKWIGGDRPTILFHHGNNEDPFDSGRFSTHTFRTIFHGHEGEIPANVIAVRAPFHTLSTREFARQMGDLENFTSMLSGSVAGVEALNESIQNTTSSPVVLSGFSLGGWVTNLHRAYHGTATVYAPLFAGAALDHLFCKSAYRRMVAPTALDNADKLTSVLNFEQSLSEASGGTVLGLLGRYDQFIRIEAQRDCYAEGDLTIVSKGHVTGSIAGALLRGHILKAM